MGAGTNIVKAIARVNSFVTRGGNVVAGWGAWLLMCLVVGDVGGRYLLGRPIRSTIEMSQTLMVILVFLAFAHAHAERRNVRVNVLTKRLSKWQQTALDIVAQAIGLALFATLTWQSWGWAWSAWEIKAIMEGSLGVPSWLSKFAVPVGGFLLSVQFLFELVHQARELRRMKT